MLASTHDSSDDNSSPTTDIDMPDPEDGHLLLYGWGQKNQKTKETDLRAKSASKEEDEDHNDDGGPGPGGAFTL